MALGDDLRSEVRQTLREQWTTRNSRSVPEPNNLGLGNDAAIIAGTVLYADLNDSTGLVDSYRPGFAAEMYKSYLECAARIIRSEQGVITAYDGDRIMSVFSGNRQQDRAAKVALKINYAVVKIINPAIAEVHPRTNYKLSHVVGIDTSDLFVARTGIRGSNDLVWVGRAANHAAKLTDRSGAASQITAEVYNGLSDSCKVNGQPPRSMWNQTTSAEIGHRTIYTSAWWWPV